MIYIIHIYKINELYGLYLMEIFNHSLNLIIFIRLLIIIAMI